MAVWNIRREDIDAFLAGMATYGTGGGGNPETGRALLEAGLSAGRTFQIVDPEDVPDDAWICSGGIMGSVRRLRDEEDEETEDPESSAKMLVEAIRTMEEIKGRKVDYLIPFEVGGSNTPVILSAAAMMGIPAIDADGVGRAAPETQMTIWIGKGISLTPMPVVAQDGNRVVVMDGNEPTYADEIGRVVVVKGGGTAANAHYFMSGRQMKECSCLRILSRALELGRVQTAGLRAGENQFDAVCRMLGGKTLISGKIRSEQGVDEGGFYLTELLVDGTGPWAGQEAKLILKNETMLIWVNGKLRSVLPDYIFMLDPATGISIQTADICAGMEIAFVGAPCDPRLAETLQTEIGRKAFSCGRYGHPELSYIPYAQLQA